MTKPKKLDQIGVSGLSSRWASQLANVRSIAHRYNQRAQEALKELFLLCGRPLPDKEGIEPTSLFSNNRDVNNLNNNRIKALEGDEVVSTCILKIAWICPVKFK